MPGDLAATVDIDHRRTVHWSLVRLGALACRVDGLVLEQDDRVGFGALGNLSMQSPLLRPRPLVVHRIGAEAGLHILDSPHAFECRRIDRRPFAAIHRLSTDAVPVDNFRSAGADPGTLLGMALEDISGYSLRRGLGSGSAGTVWLLRDLATGRHAVLKRIPKTGVAVKSDFLGDLELTRTIDHPHVARLLEVRESDREWLLFSQYVAAGTLASLLERRGALSPGELVTLVSPLAQGLSALHRAGLTHGHLGIDDIMFDADGRPVITDAGLRTLAPPSTPEADLAALGSIARQAGGDAKTFPPSLFTTNGDLLAQQALHRAQPLPIDLGFTQDRHPTSRDHPGTTEPTARQPSPPLPTDASPPKAATDSPHKQSSATDSAARQPNTPPPTDAPQATLTPLRPTPTTSQPAPETSQSALAASRIPPATSQSALAASRPAPGTSRSAPDTSRSGTREGGRLSRPTHRRSPRRPPSRRQSVRQLLRTKRAAYGILAACGAGAAVTVAIGLATLGALGNPATSATASADQSTKPTPPPTPPTQRATSAPTSTPHQRTQTLDSKKWLQTLQALDVRRSRAFSTLNPADLNTIYVPGSPPWSADRALLTSYRDRHIRIEGLRMQIETVTVETPGKTTVVLRIVDRLVSGTAITASGQRTAFPPGKPTPRRLTLTANANNWRISKITKA